MLFRALAVVAVLVVSSCSAPPSEDAGTGGNGGGTGSGTTLGGGGGVGGGTGAGTGAGGGSSQGGGSTLGGGSATGGGVFGTRDAGEPCTGPGDCGSGQCIAWFRDAGSVCGKTCLDQLDCDSLDRSYCGLARDGGGVCVPRSPAHCLPCEFDSDCGSLAEACVTGPGETTMTCRVDCSLAGAAACPSDYTCTQLRFNNEMRSFCLPPSACPSSQAGFCDRYAVPQPCSSSNDAGVCTGSRACVAGRYSTCNAMTPACRPTCTTPTRPECTEPLCDGATQLPDHCGSCTTVCPGFGSSTADVTCAMNGCTFGCRGERYDSDNAPDSGCEFADAPTGNHTSGTASTTSPGSLPCSDGSTLNTSGKLPSDTRTHAPAITGFDAMKGAAPDFLSLSATGGLTCVNDIGITLTVTGASPLNCYRLSITTDKSVYGCDTSAAGTCTVTSGSGSYSDNTTISFTVSRLCAANGAGASYTLTGHF